MEGILTISASISLVILWLSKASSLALLMLLSLSISVALLFSMMIPKLPLVMVILGLGGGLFVLIGFVILSHPWDLGDGVWIPMKPTLSLVGLVVVASWGWWESGVSLGWGEKWMSSSVGGFTVVYVFLIFLLMIFLLPLNKIMNQSDGSVYSDKKGKAM